MNKFKNIAFAIVLVFLIGVFAVSAFVLGKYWMESAENTKQTNDLANQVAQVQEQLKNEGTAPAVTAPQVTIQVSDIHEETHAVLPEYAGLYQQNSHMVGWIAVPDTNINYPVMQTPEAPDYYLRRNFQKEYLRHGSLYIEEGCDVFAPSDNLTIYGHNIHDGTMFHQLENYMKEDYWRSHQEFSFDTILERHNYEIFSVFLTTATLGEGFTYNKFIDAEDEAEFDAFVAECLELAMYDTDITPVYGDKLLCLSTCYESITNGRLVVAARRID